MKYFIHIVSLFNAILPVCLSAGNTAVQDSVRPFVLGEVRQLHSHVLNEDRILNIYLPEGYNANDTVTYPVVYLLDGSADEDFIHTVGLYQFNAFPWISRVPASIIVGIANTDRRRDFTFPTTVNEDKKLAPTGGSSGKFISFIETELQPYISSTYKTTGDKTIIGQSLGGLLAAQILIQKPQLFNRYIVISPSLWWNNGSLLEQKYSAVQDSSMGSIQVYIGVGKEGLVPGTSGRTMEDDAKRLYIQLQALNNRRLKVFFDFLPEENHATASHPAVFNALRMLYPKPE